MEQLRKKVKEALAAKSAAMVVGYEEAEGGQVRALFASKPEDADRLVLDARCTQNLALYLKKKELRKLGRIGFVAPPHVVRALLQIASENQIKEKDVTVIAIAADGRTVQIDSFADLEKHAAAFAPEFKPRDSEMLESLRRMTPEDRRKFWSGHFSRCIKCYACRAACPMCFCGRCQVEYNQPQIVTVEATPLGNLEWHFLRAMHLAGRCVACGECGRSCPVGIPVHLLSFKSCTTALESFDAAAGRSANMKSVMSDFRPDDKEDFIR